MIILTPDLLGLFNKQLGLGGSKIKEFEWRMVPGGCELTMRVEIPREIWETWDATVIGDPS